MSEPIAKQAEEISYDALKHSSAEEREAFLGLACAGNEKLRAAVDKILTEYVDADSFFDEQQAGLNRNAEMVRLLAEGVMQDRGVTSEFDADRMVGSQIGHYKLLQKIGEGGCGAVYMAGQAKPMRRQVALKVIKLGMDTKSVIARFEAERQALAMMDHPSIARVLDAGATETGRPYFVMELVHGVKITTYCDENRLDVRQRLNLFIQICGAIQHAHQKGIVHRDIKPSNILIAILDGKPMPKVIDFGIAKATGAEQLTDNTLFTANEQFVGTPVYMSPEQAQLSGMDVDTRSDIYSLGVLLYELLTGKPPFDQSELLQSGVDGMRRTLMEREPHRPSTKLDALREEELTHTTLHRRVEIPNLKSLLRGDLDWIVMMALEKDRNRRYQTANGLGMDIQRYLNNETVVARPPSRLYRLQKLVRRNKTTCVAIAAVIVALTAGFGTSTWLFFRERAARQEIERARINELQSRIEADARAKIAQAALFISRKNMVEADRLVEKIQIPVTESSLEAANVFRTLGGWHVTEGNWAKAADCFVKTLQANQVDKTDMTEQATWDLLRAGPTLIAAGEASKYQQLVQVALARFAKTRDPVAAEQIIKFTLLLPPDAATLQELTPLGLLVEDSMGSKVPHPEAKAYWFAWRSFALSLLEYRREKYQEAIAWCQKYRDPNIAGPARDAMVHIVMAMAYAKLDQPDNAQQELATARKAVDAKFPEGTDAGIELGTPGVGFWHDWLLARLLLREADTLVK